jgi:hypothetical protein
MTVAKLAVGRPYARHYRPSGGGCGVEMEMP